MPFYERLSDRRLEVGKTVRIGPGSKKAEVDIWGDNLALVSPGNTTNFTPKGKDVSNSKPGLIINNLCSRS